VGFRRKVGSAVCPEQWLTQQVALVQYLKQCPMPISFGGLALTRAHLMQLCGLALSSGVAAAVGVISNLFPAHSPEGLATSLGLAPRAGTASVAC